MWKQYNNNYTTTIRLSSALIYDNVNLSSIPSSGVLVCLYMYIRLMLPPPWGVWGTNSHFFIPTHMHIPTFIYPPPPYTHLYTHSHTHTLPPHETFCRMRWSWVHSSSPTCSGQHSGRRNSSFQNPFKGKQCYIHICVLSRTRNDEIAPFIFFLCFWDRPLTDSQMYAGHVYLW